MRLIALKTGIFLICLFILSACSKKEYVPESELGHIDIILDSATFRQLSADPFMTREFAYTFHDTTLYGMSFSIDLFMMGQENFLHISKEWSFWQGQHGGLGFVFQSKKPGMKDSLTVAWKKFTPYALEENVSNGQGYTLIEVLPVLNWQNINTPRIVPYLSTYSPESYKTWGFSDHEIATGVSMKTFMTKNFGAAISTVLFNSIAEIDINATEREEELLISALKAAGYEEKGDMFVHPVSASVKIIVNENEPFKRLNRMKIKLTRNVQPMEKVYNKLKLTFDKDECWFIVE